jgi:hypothetical protein
MKCRYVGSKYMHFMTPNTLQIPGVFRPHICALEIAGKDLLEILPTID